MNPQRGTIGPEDYQQVREVFEAALSYAAAERNSFVERACSGNTRLIGEVQRMLAADAETHPLLDGSLSGQGLREGDRFANHFEIGGTLGRGGMGEVYLGRDTKLNREVCHQGPSVDFYRRSGPACALPAGSAGAGIAQSSEYRRNL